MALKYQLVNEVKTYIFKAKYFIDYTCRYVSQTLTATQQPGNTIKLEILCILDFLTDRKISAITVQMVAILD